MSTPRFQVIEWVRMGRTFIVSTLRLNPLDKSLVLWEVVGSTCYEDTQLTRS